MWAVLRRLLKSNFIRSEHGGNAAEFAIVALPMSLMTLVLLEAGSVLFLYNDMHNEAREAVRRLAVDESVVVSSTSLNCLGATAPSPVTAQYLACANLVGWTVGFDVDADFTTGQVNGYSGAVVGSSPYASCREVTVSVATTMEKVALFNIFGILSGRPLVARATMVTEYLHDGTLDAPTATAGTVCS
jgi:Flp pilus assembly protein TadG